MAKRIVLSILAVVLIISLVGCAGSNVKSLKTEKQKEDAKMYESISQEEAKKILDSDENFVLIDSRTQEEFDEGHIEGAIMIPEYAIENVAQVLIPNEEQLILVYCRTGRRSKIAAQALTDLGYTNVKEFGGITTWKYEIVK